MKIAVTGSLGMIGSGLIKVLRGITNIQLATFDIRYNKENACYLDINNKHELEQKIQDCDGIIHLAAIARVDWGEKNSALCNRVNIDGTQNIIKACLSSKKKPWLIFASSREVYGTQKSLPVVESCIPNPINTYAKTKLIGEELVKDAYLRGLKAFILRFTNVYGATFDYRDRVVPSFCLNALKNYDLIVKGNNVVLDFVFIDDVVEAILKVVDFLQHEKGKFLPLLNISTSEPTSLLELAEIIIKNANSRSNITSLPKNSYAVCEFCGCNILARKIIGWQPRFDLNSGIKKFISSLNCKIPESVDINTIHMRLTEDESFKSYSWLPAEI